MEKLRLGMIERRQTLLRVKKKVVESHDYTRSERTRHMKEESMNLTLRFCDMSAPDIGS